MFVPGAPERKYHKPNGLKKKKKKIMSHGSGGKKDVIEMWTGPRSL